MNEYPQLLVELKRDHVRFATIIQVLESELKKIVAGHSEDWKLLADSFEYIEAYPDLVHHPREDAIYRYCRESRPDMAQALLELEQEHAQIAGATASLSEQLQAVFAEDMLNREVLIAGLENYLKMQKSHMANEENTVFPMLLEILSESEWDALLEAAETPQDPLFEDESRLAYNALYERIMTREQGE